MIFKLSDENRNGVDDKVKRLINVFFYLSVMPVSAYAIYTLSSFVDHSEHSATMLWPFVLLAIIFIIPILINDNKAHKHIDL